MDLHKGQRVLVMGLAKSGEAVARLLLSKGAQVTVNEKRDRREHEPEADALVALGATVVFGGHPIELLNEPIEFIVKNPGIPYHVPFLQEAQKRNVPIFTEIEVASWYTEAPIYSITGSNGKTTTTTLLGRILQSAKFNPVVAGNIGHVLSDAIAEVVGESPIVLEVSSFQLLGTREFHPQIAALLNFYPAHLDYHGTFEEYQDAKWMMFQNQTERDVAVLNYDQERIRSRAEQLRSQVVWFSRSSAVDVGTYVENGAIFVNREGVKTEVISLSDVVIMGEHNLENVLCATAMAIWAGASLEAIREVLSAFRGVEHRTEFVRQVAGVDYYNDSKATNPQAALQALKAFPENVVWVAGGLNRGVSFKSMVDELKHRVKAAILLGESRDLLKEACLEAEVPVITCVDSLEQAIERAADIAKAGDVVLLSPACASWDMFSSFEERGRMFKEYVHRL